MTIGVVVIDDQHLVRAGLISLLQLADNIKVLGQAADGDAAIAAIEQLQPDVVLMDIRMPGCDGITALQRLREAGNQTPVLLLTTFDDHETILQALRAGAKGYLLKDVSLDTLVEAIQSLHSGGSWLQPVITSRIVEGLQGLTSAAASSEPVLEALTDRELAILQLMAAGLSNHEIAASLFKSTGTIKNQVSTVLAKLGVHDRTRAVLKAIELGLLS
ncbi:response regulator transcription factor [Pseudidiomarina mangrovi]|uniref:response regulator transcription factor n=1 Tax=Pseudidiomarina mangrovi TaxID=2487133 RepID=UPI000FCBBA93|nr:response regulator transcription factor [Pseudidiomarina mangrovi]